MEVNIHKFLLILNVKLGTIAVLGDQTRDFAEVLVFCCVEPIEHRYHLVLERCKMGIVETTFFL